MKTPDFLKTDAQTPLVQNYLAAGVPLSLATNFEPLIRIADEAFARPKGKTALTGIRLRIWVDASGRSVPPWPKPYFRGLGHLIFAGFDEQNSLLIDLREKLVLGRFTPALAADRSVWLTVIFPVLLATMGATAGLTVLHCGCVAWKGSGLLLAGRSGSGKSTLSLALAQSGFDFLSDDRTVISYTEGRLLAWNLTTHLKLRSGAARQFPALEGIDPNDVFNGEKVYLLDPVENLHLARVRCCWPRWIFFLERQEDPKFALTEIPSGEAADRLEEGLPRETPEAVQRQREAIETLVDSECWELRYGGEPHTVARALRDFISERQRSGGGRSKNASSHRASGEAVRQDPLRRFTPTPLVADLPVMGRTLRLQTNSPAVLECARRAFSRYSPGFGDRPQFLWRIVSEADGFTKPPWPELSAFSDRGLRFVNVGQRCFVAVDLESREAVGYVPQALAEDEAGFSGVFLAMMFYLTAGGLGLTPLSAACVATAGRGLLLLGKPGSGKTTSGYLAKRMGLEFCADQATFLEFQGTSLHAWGEFWPAAFRTETAQFHPELAALTRPLVHRQITFLSMEKEKSSSPRARSVIPVACIFLEREAADPPKLVPLSPDDFARRLRRMVPFKDDSVSEEKSRAVFRALTDLPAYRLLYGKEPSVAGVFFRSVLKTERQMEART